MANLITREILRTQFKEKLLNGNKIEVASPVDLVESSLSILGFKGAHEIDDTILNRLNTLKQVHRNSHLTLTGKYHSGLDVAFGDRGSVSSRLMRGVFSGSANTLNDNWEDLYDALRIDLTMRKEARPTVRQFIYDEVNMPNASKDVRPTELFPIGLVFEENNGEGESIRQGGNLGGQYDTIAMKIYAAGFMWTLLASLFDPSYELSRLADGAALGYSAKKDDLALSPIISASYSGTQQTAASTVGTLRQEKLYNTILDAVDDLGDRTDPVTDRKIDVNDCVILASSFDARHINRVLGGLGKTTPENYGSIPEVKAVIGYDGEVIDMPNETITYSGVTKGTAYLIKPNRYFKIPIKRGLTAEIDKTPDVATLAREQRAWYFAEGIYNSVGIANFVQEITLPTW